MRKQFWVALSVVSMSLWAAPREAFALKKPLCSNVTCTGGAPKLVANGARGLSHPEIVPIFWGTYWNGTATPSRGQMVGAIQALTNGAYFGALNQYGGSSGNTVGPARMVPTAPTFTGTPVASPKCDNGAVCTVGGTACTDGSACGMPLDPVQATIEKMIANGSVPGPTAGTDMLYVVFVPPGKSSFDWNIGRNCTAACGAAFDGLPYNMAMVVAGDTAGLAHELVEAMSNNFSDANCTYTTGGAANQIGDLCGCYAEQQMVGTSNPLWVPAYWSKADAACVIPEGWNGVWSYNFSNWTEIHSGTVRQVYSGKYGVFATDTNDNLVRVGSSGTVGGPGAMFAVGNTSVLGLTPDTGAVYEYNGSTWTAIGGGASSIYAGGHKVATDFSGNPYTYKNGTWTEIGGWSDQFAVNEAGLFALSSDHGGTWLNAGATPTGWVKIGGSADELFVGLDHGIARTSLATLDVSYWSGSGSSWFAQGAPGNMFAVTMDGFLFGLNPARQGIFMSTNTATNSPPWTAVGGTSGRLIARGDAGGDLLATGVVVY